METQVKFKKKDFVGYHQGGYQYTNELNEYGDRLVEDWHIDAYGTVVACYETTSLVMFHTKIDEEAKKYNTVKFFQIYFLEVSNQYLTLNDEPSDFQFEF